MNLDELKKATTGPVYPKARLVIHYENGLYGYEINTQHPTFGPVEIKSTWSYSFGDNQVILEAKRELRKMICKLEVESKYPKVVEVDLTPPVEPEAESRLPWLRRWFK